MKNSVLPLLLVLSFFYPFAVKASAEFLPPSCIPKYVATAQVKSTETLAIISYKGSTYHYLIVFGIRKNETLRAVIRKNSACYLSFVDPGEAYSLSEGVPVPVAQQLALIAYKNAIKKRGGIESYQRWFLTRKLNPLAPEDAFALRKLGIKIPSSTKILPWSKIKEHEQRIGS